MKCHHLFAASAAAILLASCESKKDGAGSSSSKFPPHDNTEVVEAFYKADPERYVFSSIDKLPPGLPWENGSELPEIGSPDAVKGGTEYKWLPDFPRTIRQVGPDSNGAFRNYLHDTNNMTYAYRHPNVEGYFPGVAKEWALDWDNQTVYVRINPDARWADGEKITTEDTLFQFYFRTSKDTNAPFGQHHYKDSYEKITVYDDYTFAVTLRSKKPDLPLWVLSMTPVPRHFYTEHGPDFVQRYQWRPLPTSGPYLLDEKDIKKGRSITLRRNRDWWAKDLKFWRYRYNIDTTHYAIIRDTTKMYESFMSHDLDMCPLNLTKSWYFICPDDHEYVANGYIHKYIFWNDIPRDNLGLWMNTSKPLLDNRDIRTGIQFASNWDVVIEKFYRGDYQRTRTASDGYGDMSVEIPLREFSPEKAQAEFAKAGFKKRGPDGILVNDKGERLSFTITTGYKSLADILTILKQEALKAGLEFDIEVLELTAAWKKVQEKKHEIGFVGTASSTTEKYPRYWDFWHSGNAYEDGKPKPQTNNFSVTSLPELDPLIEQYRHSTDHEEKRQLAAKIEPILHQHAAWVPGSTKMNYRLGSWRWVHWPEDFNVKRSELQDDYHLHWISDSERTRTLQAMKDGKTYPKVVKQFTQYKLP